MNKVKFLRIILILCIISTNPLHNMNDNNSNNQPEKSQHIISYWPASQIKDFIVNESEKIMTSSSMLNQVTFINIAIALELMNQKKHNLAREILKFISSNQNEEIAQLLKTEQYNTPLATFNQFCEKNKNKTYPELCQSLISKIMEMDVRPLHYLHPYRAVSYNSYYTDKEEEYSLTDQTEWQSKQINAYQLLLLKKPTTVLDIGANMGWFSQLAAKNGSRVIATDIYPYSVDYLYSVSKEKSLSITPLELPFEELITNLETCQSDMVFFFAIIHHLVFIRGIKLEQIFETLSKVTKKTLVFEFVDINDENIQRAPTNPTRWNTNKTFELIIETLNGYAKEHYNLENCLSLGKKFFSKVEILKSHPETRKILVFTK